MMNNPILITGATGNVGSEIVSGLLAVGAYVRAAVLPSSLGSPALDSRVEQVGFDFLDPATFPQAFDGVKRMFLVRPPQLSNVSRDIAPAIEAAQAAGVEHVVFLSLVGVEKNPVVPHYKIEKLLLASGMQYTFLRASFFMQNLSTTHRSEIRERGEIYVPAGHGKTSFIDVRDIAEVAVRALSEDGHENRAYTLTGAESLDYHEVAQILSDELGRPVCYANPSILQFARRTRRNGTPMPFVLVMSALYTTARLGLADVVTREAEDLLGRRPRTVREYVRDYRGAWA